MRSCFRVDGLESYLRRIDSCITQLKAQGPSRTCDESKEEVKKEVRSCFRDDGLETGVLGLGIGNSGSGCRV